MEKQPIREFREYYRGANIVLIDGITFKDRYFEEEGDYTSILPTDRFILKRWYPVPKILLLKYAGNVRSNRRKLPTKSLF